MHLLCKRKPYLSLSSFDLELFQKIQALLEIVIETSFDCITKKIKIKINHFIILSRLHEQN
ncbi:hypothetical protein BpHYR1_047693 [Brachionus plicatilis]|uniref:Uncharacterized protein n=1 Tax=Brachionus plicatilis TaxID=10195 RepID=A0A3M7T2X6_BRAPC|nr:hypothetical protein BpHYR1_047693 [Brachionus plicatilis]